MLNNCSTIRYKASLLRTPSRDSKFLRHGKSQTHVSYLYSNWRLLSHAHDDTYLSPKTRSGKKGAWRSHLQVPRGTMVPLTSPVVAWLANRQSDQKQFLFSACELGSPVSLLTGSPSSPPTGVSGWVCSSSVWVSVVGWVSASVSARGEDPFSCVSSN